MKRVLVPIGVLIALLLTSIAAERLLGGERPWLNVIRHLSLGLVSAWFYARTWQWASPNSYDVAPVWFRIISCTAGALLLGVVWEIVEWKFDLVVTRNDVGNPYDDTIKDLMMNLIGASTPFVYMHVILAMGRFFSKNDR